jgi:hypothetical protein
MSTKGNDIGSTVMRTADAPMSICFDDPSLYIVFMFGERSIVSNLLLSIAYYKSRAGEVWPAELVVHEDNRIDIGIGHNTVVRRTNWNLRDAVYMSLYKCLADPHNGKQQPVVLPITERKPVTYSVALRMREDLHK